MPRNTDEEMTTPYLKDGNPYRTPGAVGTSPVSMFGSYAAAKKRKMPAWAVPLLTAAAIFHVALFVTMWIKSIWELEQLERPKITVDLAIAPPPPPPPPPPPGGAKPQTQVITPKKIKVK